MTRQIRIESDGTPPGTRVVYADTGEQLPIPIASIDWHVEANKPAMVTITAYVTHVDVVGIVKEARVLSESCKRPVDE